MILCWLLWMLKLFYTNISRKDGNAAVETTLNRYNVNTTLIGAHITLRTILTLVRLVTEFANHPSFLTYTALNTNIMQFLYQIRSLKLNSYFRKLKILIIQIMHKKFLLSRLYMQKAIYPAKFLV